jgi:Zn-dependent protease with chaperone function
VRFVERAPADEENVNVTAVHPLREAAWLGGVLLCALLLVFGVLTLGVEAAVERIPADVEARVFGRLVSEVELEAAAEPPRAPAARALLERLAARWPDAPYDFRLGVLDEDAPNAMAVPGGVILVTRGLLEKVESENELAFVLAHELGHFRNRDHLRRLGRGMVLLMLVTTLTMGAVETSGPGLMQTVDQVAGRTLDRSQEIAADGFALELVHAEFGHVGGSEAFFERLVKDGSSLDRFAAYLSTHPAPKERLARLQAMATARGWSAAEPLVPFGEAPP